MKKIVAPNHLMSLGNDLFFPPLKLIPAILQPIGILTALFSTFGQPVFTVQC